MFDLYSWPTPNGQKVSIMLEECGLKYNVHPVNIGQGDQFKAEFLAISPNNKIPALVDSDGPKGKLAVFETGAILFYLAEKTGQFFPKSGPARYDAMQWLMFQMGGIGPMMGQNNHFRSYAPEKLQYAIDRYSNEVKRLFGVVDKRLHDRPFLTGEYSIADIACFPWMQGYERHGINIEEFVCVKHWLESIRARPAVVKGMAVLQEHRRQGPMDDKAKQWLFGPDQYKKRA